MDYLSWFWQTTLWHRYIPLIPSNNQRESQGSKISVLLARLRSGKGINGIGEIGTFGKQLCQCLSLYLEWQAMQLAIYCFKAFYDVSDILRSLWTRPQHDINEVDSKVSLYTRLMVFKFCHASWSSGELIRPQQSVHSNQNFWGWGPESCIYTRNSDAYLFGNNCSRPRNNLLFSLSFFFFQVMLICQNFLRVKHLVYICIVKQIEFFQQCIKTAHLLLSLFNFKKSVLQKVHQL